MTEDRPVSAASGTIQTIDEQLKVLSIPPGWALRTIEFSPEGLVWAIYCPPRDHKAWFDGKIMGKGRTIDEALRDAQNKVWERWKKFGGASSSVLQRSDPAPP